MVNSKVISVVLSFFLFFTMTAESLADPYKSYIYDFWGNPVPAPQAYVPEKTIDGMDLGVGTLREPRDLFVDQNNRIYLLDTGNRRLLIFNPDWVLEQEIRVFNNQGVDDQFQTPVSVYVGHDGGIFVADRDQSRILEFDQQGKLRREIGPPQSDVSGVLSDDFHYRPLKVVVDRAGRIYVLADGIYEGFMEFDVDGNFRGFIGAPPVKPTILDLFWARFATREQRRQMALFLPTEYSAVDLDERGFIYAAEGNQIGRLNPTGVDVLRRTGFFFPVGDVPTHKDYRVSEEINPTHFTDIVARSDGMYSALDRQRGRIFTYDEKGNLLYIFGGLGNTEGTFTAPVALDMVDDTFLVLDRTQNRISLFRPTEYAQVIHKAIHHYQEGEYDEATAMWQQVLDKNLNFDVAYSGIGTALLRQNRYEEAMFHFKLGNNRKDYSTAYGLYRREILSENFGFLVVTTVLIVGAVYLLYRKEVFHRFYGFILAKEAFIPTAQQRTVQAELGLTAESRWSWGRFRKGLKETIRSIGYAWYVIFHPFDGFWDLKHEKRGNMPAAVSLLSLVTITYVIVRQYTGFIFNPRNTAQLNILQEIASVIIPFLLWTGVNWALTTLMDGKGTFRDIVITTAFALTPIIIVNIPMTIVSNFITLEEGAFYYFFVTVGLVWALGLVFLGTMVIHDYNMGKNLGAAVLTIVGMGIVLFIGLLFFSVINLMAGFITSIYLELVLRL